MRTIYNNNSLKEFHDLISISALDQTLKTSLSTKVDNGELDQKAFDAILTLLREEDSIDKEIQQHTQTIANFDPEKYMAHMQEVVDKEVKKIVRS